MCYILGVELDQAKQKRRIYGFNSKYECKMTWIRFLFIWFSVFFIENVEFECFNGKSRYSVKKYVHTDIKILWCVDDITSTQEKNENCQAKTVHSKL